MLLKCRNGFWRIIQWQQRIIVLKLVQWCTHNNVSYYQSWPFSKRKWKGCCSQWQYILCDKNMICLEKFLNNTTQIQFYLVFFYVSLNLSVNKFHPTLKCCGSMRQLRNLKWTLGKVRWSKNVHCQRNLLCYKKSSNFK